MKRRDDQSCAGGGSENGDGIPEDEEARVHHPDVPPPLPDTPENRARKAELWRQMMDPSTPLGATMAAIRKLPEGADVPAAAADDDDEVPGA